MDVTERGVTLRFLLQLVEGGAVDGSWTIQQVVDRFVRPMTATSKCCLYDVAPEPSCPGRPQYFVSHTWSRKMSDLLQLLKDHFNVDAPSDAAAGVVLWLDIVAINQHPYEPRWLVPPSAHCSSWTPSACRSAASSACTRCGRRS